VAIALFALVGACTTGLPPTSVVDSISTGLDTVPTTTQAPTTTEPTTTSIFVTPGAPELLMRCGERIRPYESPPGDTYSDCGWVTITDPFWSVATWELDPVHPPGPAESTVVLLAAETGCISRSLPEGLEIRPVLRIAGDEIVILILVEGRTMPGNCDGSNPQFPVTVDLGAPLGGRRLFDGKLVPPPQRYPVP
jgi:hypothetical protein